MIRYERYLSTWELSAPALADTRPLQQNSFVQRDGYSASSWPIHYLSPARYAVEIVSHQEVRWANDLTK
jgi:hypothetical protein